MNIKRKLLASMRNDKNQLIWYYSNEDLSHSFDLYETGKGFLKLKPQGIIYKRGFEELYRVITEYKEKSNKDITLLIDAEKLIKVDIKARKISLMMTNRKSPVKKVAIINLNYLMRNYIKLYSIIAKKPIKSFKTKKEATAWLKKNKKE